MRKIKGETIKLYTGASASVDGFDIPIPDETTFVSVDDVLIGRPQSDDVVNNFTTEGRKAVYVLGIPKGDTHDWENKVVEFFGQKFKTFGKPIQGIEANIPLRWNKQVYVEAYE